jgi:DedD protein
VKERLTGAIILVALLVLLVPELLTGPVRSAPRSQVAASSAEEPPLRSYTINMADDGRSHGAAAASGPEQPAPLPAAPADPAADSAAPQAAPAPPAAQTSAPAPPAPAHTNKPTAAPVVHLASAASPGGAYVVQLGSFASRQNAEHLAQQVRAQGFNVSVSQGSGGRHLYRVRVGPAHDHGAAAQLAQQLSAAGHSGSVVPR